MVGELENKVCLSVIGTQGAMRIPRAPFLLLCSFMRCHPLALFPITVIMTTGPRSGLV